MSPPLWGAYSDDSFSCGADPKGPLRFSYPDAAPTAPLTGATGKCQFGGGSPIPRPFGVFGRDGLPMGWIFPTDNASDTLDWFDASRNLFPVFMRGGLGALMSEDTKLPCFSGEERTCAVNPKAPSFVALDIDTGNDDDGGGDEDAME